jgi:serine/threonine-protein kinase
MPRTRTLLAITVSTLAAPAGAQPAQRDPIAAEALFERGKQLVDAGRTAEACAAFSESERLDPAGGTMLRLALCREAEGKLASAWLGFTEVARISKEGSGEPAKLQERIRIARDHLAAIEPRLPRLAIAVPPAARVDGLAVSANGSPRNEGTWGVALPVDPGDVAVVATARGHREYRATVHLAEGQQLIVDVPPLPMLAPVPPLRAEVTDEHPSPLRPIGIALGVAGLAAIGVGTYFGVRAMGKWHDASNVCPGSTCADPSGVSLAGDAKDAARVADVTLSAGAAAVLAGLVLYVVGAPRVIHLQGTVGLVSLPFE